MRGVIVDSRASFACNYKSKTSRRWWWWSWWKYLQVKKNQDKPKEERWLLLTLFKHKAKENREGRAREFNKSSSFFFTMRSFSHIYFFSSSSFSPQRLFICQLSFSRFLFSLLLSPLILSRTICFSISAYILLHSSHFIRGHAKVNKNSNSTPIVTTPAHHHL